MLQTPVVSCPREIRDVADDFKDLVGCHYQAFVAVLCAYLFGIANFSDIARFLLFSPSVSSLSRFFDETELYQKLNRRQRRIVLRCLERNRKKPNRYVLAIDDTLIPHSGHKIWGTYYWKDHKSGGSLYGHKLLVLGLVDTDKKVLIPLYWEILHRAGLSDKAAHEKGWEVALRLLNEAVAFGFPRTTAVLDSWFAGNEFFDQLTQQGFRFVVEIKDNRKVIRHRQTHLDVSVAEFFAKRPRHKIIYRNRSKWATSAILRLNKAQQRLNIVAVANQKGLVHDCFAYYASNQLTWDTTKIWSIARDRWTIEVQFRDLKQLFALGGAAVRSRHAVETSLSLSMIALTVVRLEQMAQVDAKTNPNKPLIPAAGIVRQYQLQSLHTGIFKLTSANETQIVKKFRARFNPRNFGQKPTVTFETVLAC